ncbi:pantetheine-phosphate adenylyltransferase [Neomoorella thermoacetica]|uniref:Phosphopantetheine adenylyltransferase n=3 Tax=Neomoorella thermoacetica TaxID=1525 RepID=COAD_MOOTA|nr:pantetheine-phosphate adenylyltransferase [Moorella thermoacetica]Q2RHB8.1 RecName: Full=Phosphopantetheine adenylyltransferase; AltName: Full=Dephospho-CoA pyrophosphorylase; AltName: Full=Pantetheine-phosphate adenylyltransferase; Short=PPAT [Moorella thermoacetica ATCC 39073]GAF25036.1 phosphopantetheine adenylyltransferase [Moorella thermoacetica Y72]AKX94687.1 phosphopantetheine adenylyltransferase [Moorella thermoacetica]AKX97320.1 phosphopantetheine adenylyltransferase [Moorella therm
MKVAVYPGTFDPITNGHLDIIRRAVSIFDRVVVGVAADNYKKTLFSLEERVELVRTVTRDIPGVTVKSFSGLLVDFARREEAVAIVRGLRAVSDFEYEFQMSIMNKKLASDLETVFLMTATEYSFLSSSIIRQAASLGGCIHGLVPPEVERVLLKRYGFL